MVGGAAGAQREKRNEVVVNMESGSDGRGKECQEQDEEEGGLRGRMHG